MTASPAVAQSLPLFPTKALSPEELQTFSGCLIDAYWNLRLTTPYPRTLGIKNIRIQLPPLPGRHEVETEAMTTESRVTAEPTYPAESRGESATSAKLPVAEKCFLHPKPRPSCPRCQKFLEWKHASSDDQQFKRHRPS